MKLGTPTLFSSLLMFGSLVAGPRLAAADAESAAYDLQMEFVPYGERLPDLRTRWADAVNEAQTLEACRAALAKARKAGLPSGHRIDGEFTGIAGAKKDDSGTYITLGAADAVCVAFGKARLAAVVGAPIAEAAYGQVWMGMIKKEDNHAENGAKLTAYAEACAKAVDQGTKGGLGAGDVVGGYVKGVPKTWKLGEVKATICEPLAKAAATFGAEVTRAAAEKRERLAAPFKKVGIGGDRLEFLIGRGSYDLRGTGYKALSTAQQLKAAKVIFYVVKESDVLFKLIRVEFDGDAQVSASSSDFDRTPPVSAYR